MTPSSSPSRYDEQAQRLAHCLALEIKKLDRKPPEHSSAWYDFERLGALAVTLGTQGAMLLVETGYLERALGSRRWKALASCCKLGLVPGHLVVQAYLGDSSSRTDLSADILDQKKYLIDLKFCTQAMLLDAVDPPQFGIRSASVAYNLWLELAMHSCSGAEVAEYASTIVSTFDPMEPILALAAESSGLALLREHSVRLGRILAQAPGVNYQSNIGIQFWLCDILAPHAHTHAMVSHLSKQMACVEPIHIATNMLHCATLLGHERLDRIYDTFKLSPLHILSAFTPYMLRSTTSLFMPPSSTFAPFFDTGFGWIWDKIDRLGVNVLTRLERDHPKALDWRAWHQEAIALGRWKLASAWTTLFADQDLSPDSKAFAHGIACIVSNRVPGKMVTDFSPGSSLHTFALRCLERQANPLIYCAEARSFFESTGLGFHFKTGPDWFVEIASMAERTAVSKSSSLPSASTARALRL